MPSQTVRILKIVCGGLLALCLFKLTRVMVAPDPLAGIDLAALESARIQTSPEPAKPPAPETKVNPPLPPAGRGGPTPRGAAGPPLPPTVQTRVNRVKDSEILGMVHRPLPMALLGIAGKDAFLRSPGGQTGLVREGEELGGLKLLQIGTNRVLVEHEGQTKELMLFEGFGSKSLLQPAKESKP